MKLNECRLGLAVTGSFCTIPSLIKQIDDIVKNVKSVTPIISENVAKTDTRFGTAAEFITTLEEKTGQTVISTIPQAEPIGPQKLFDVLAIAPCTGNTLSKLACGITDTTVTMAAKAHMRNNRPLVIAISTNDALGMSARNLGVLMNAKNVYFVPFYQDMPFDKENSLISDLALLLDVVEKALVGEQLQPLVTVK